MSEKRREANATTHARRGWRKALAQLAVLGLVIGAFATTVVSVAGADEEGPKVPCENQSQIDAASRHHRLVAVCKAGPETAVAGTDVAYTLTVYANGHRDHNFQITDEIPSGTTYVSADGGGVWDCSFADPTVTCTAEDVSGDDINGSVVTITVHVDPGFTDEGIENCATIQKIYDFESDSIENDFNHEWTSCADTTITREADVSIVKTSESTSLVVPADVVYTITATNDGPSTSDPVTFNDTLPDGTTLTKVDGPDWDCSASTATVLSCTTLAGLEVGASSSVEVTLSVPASQAGTDLVNCASQDTTDTINVSTGDDPSCYTIPGGSIVEATSAAVPLTAVTPKFTG